MYLRRIKLAGFKSFVDPTPIPVRGNISSIVGPNGCGKSNVVDAIRWVIGEISAKQLRGQSMTDVIFNGTTQRKPVGKASVELLFDNEDGRVGGEYAQYAEIAVRREVERDGQSSYFINNVHVRRRDIIDLFLGTGLGPRSYAIIEQGMISQLIEAKPEEMRVYIEEVAGISKYRERRRETENRMQHTQENLDRLNDIREELDKQLRHLKRQASAAERYKVYKQEERLLTSQIKALQWKALEEKRVQQDQLISDQMLVREEKRSQQSQLGTEIEKNRALLTEFTENAHTIQKSFYELGAEIARIEQRIKDHEEQSKRWERELEESQALRQELQDNTFECEQQIKELKSEISQLQPQAEKSQVEASKLEELHDRAEAELNQWEKEWEAFQHQTSETSRNAEVSRTKIEHYQQQMIELANRKSDLTKHLEELQVHQLQNEIDPITSNANTIDQRLQETTLQLQSYADEIANLRQMNQTMNVELQTMRRDLQGFESRRASLDALQKSALGAEDEEANHWLSSRGLIEKPRLGHSMRVHTGWELAVETVMNGYFDAVCVDAVDSFIEEMENLTKGQVTLFERQTPASAIPSLSAKTLLSYVDSDSPLQSWLANVYAVDSIENAKAFRRQLRNHESVVTKEGVWMGVNWVRVSKQQNPQSGFLLREQQLNQLNRELEQLTTQFESKQKQLETSEARLNQLEMERDVAHQRHQTMMLEVTDVQKQLSAKQTHLKDTLERQTRLQASLSECEEQIKKIEQTLLQSRSDWDSYQHTQQDQSEKRYQMLEQRDTCRDRLRELREKVQEQRKKADECVVRLSANESQFALLEQTLSRYNRQITQLNERFETLSDHLSQKDAPIEAMRTELQAHLSRRLKIETDLREAEGKVDQVNQSRQELEKKQSAIQKEINDIQAQLEELRMERQTILVRQTTIQEQLKENSLELQAVVENLPLDATILNQEEKLSEVAKQLERLGPINLAAIKEYDSTNERKTYLDKQNQDLMEALSILQEAIRKIDRETRVKFQETFNRINENFQHLFPKIFGGGQVALEMTEEDLLTTGIIVRAQPPGKRNSTIHMLSGGEKALTAIALVFSLFQLNPAPFCILDEVDAPLDDVNVGRFCSLVKEMSKTVQFLIISHNKVTIEMADNLMGVTMQEPGVSRIVSVDMHEALDMVEAA